MSTESTAAPIIPIIPTSASIFKRKLTELEQLCKELQETKDTITPSEKKACVSTLKSAQDGLIKMYSELKEQDPRLELWTDKFTLKLTGFSHGLHPNLPNVRNMFLYIDGVETANTANAINVRDSMFIHGDYGMDYVIVSFETPEDKQKVKRLKNLTCNTKGRGGIYQFKAKFSEPNEF